MQHTGQATGLGMTKTERVRAALRGEPVDRPPICFWHHFRPAGSGLRQAEETYSFFVEKFDLDIIKVMPDIPYPFPRRSIRQPEEWLLLEPLNPARSRFFRERAVTVRELRKRVGNDTPIIVTVFSPWTEILHFATSPQQALEHAERFPSLVHEALATVAENLRLHLQDIIDAGADGVFFALQGCTSSIMSREHYRALARPYDLLALQGARDGWLNVLHIHGERDLFIDDVLDYPVQVLSWSDRLAGPSLAEMRQKTPKTLMGGWHEFGPLSNGPEDAIRAEAEDAFRQTGGRGWILANGCSVPDDTDERWLYSARRIAETLTSAPPA